MYLYRIFSKGTFELGQLYAITPEDAVSQWNQGRISHDEERAEYARKVCMGGLVSTAKSRLISTLVMDEKRDDKLTPSIDAREVIQPDKAEHYEA